MSTSTESDAFSVLTCSRPHSWLMAERSAPRFSYWRVFYLFWISPRWSPNAWTCSEDLHLPLCQGLWTSALSTFGIVYFFGMEALLWTGGHIYAPLVSTHCLPTVIPPCPQSWWPQMYPDTVRVPGGGGRKLSSWEPLLYNHCLFSECWCWTWPRAYPITTQQRKTFFLFLFNKVGSKTYMNLEDILSIKLESKGICDRCALKENIWFTTFLTLRILVNISVMGFPTILGQAGSITLPFREPFPQSIVLGSLAHSV